MELKEYQERAKTTAIYPEKYRIYYPALGLASEVGETLNHIKKKMRDDKELPNELMIGELGDVLWYISQLATDLGLDLDMIAQQNLAKLKDRMEKGKIQGSGEKR